MAHCLFLAEVSNQALTAWVWLTVECCMLQMIDPKTKCSLSSALCRFCGGAAGHRASGNAVLQELSAHYYLHHDRVSHVHQPNAFKNTLVGFKSLIRLL